MHIPSFTLLLIAGSGLALVGCSRSFDEQRTDALRDAQCGRIPDAVAEINDLYSSHGDNEPAKPGGSPKSGQSVDDQDALLWHMERGALAQLADARLLSDQHLDEAARLVDERRTKSVAREIGTALLNDTTREYAGRPYEHAMVDYLRGLNRLLAAERTSGLVADTTVTLPTERSATPPATLPTDAAPTSGGDAGQLYDQALSVARHMVIEQLQHTAEDGADSRYSDDPFARLMAAVTVLAMPPATRTSDDWQFADVMMKKASSAYAKLARNLANDRALHYETPTRPALLETLLVRVCRTYDADAFDQRATEFGFSERDSRFTTLAQPAGTGSILVLNHAGFVMHPEELAVRIVAAATPGSPPSPGSADYRVGALVFWATGPGAESLKCFAALSVPPDVVHNLLAPGGAAYMGFALPSCADDRLIPPTAIATIARLDTSGPIVTQSLETVHDIDAIARADLRDRQPGIITKTLIRAAAKQIAAGAISHEVAKQNELLGLLTNLFTSSLATVSESADLRAWTMLPDHIEATLIDLPPGSYSVTIAAGYGATSIARAEVRPGMITVLPVRTFPPTLRVAPAINRN
jgi:hypothetical protein